MFEFIRHFETFMQSIVKGCLQDAIILFGEFCTLGPWGAPQAPLWSLANIQCVAANITPSAAVILHGLTIILRIMTSICSNMHDILHFQQQFFQQVFWDFQREKYTFFQKCSKIGVVAKKWLSLFRGKGGSEPKVINIIFFFLNP